MAVEPKVVTPKVVTPKPKVALDKGVDQDQDQQNTVQDEAAAGRVRHPGPWVKLHKDSKENQKLILRHSHAGNLKGHDHKTGEVILVDPDFEAPKTAQEIADEEMAAQGPTAGIKG